ncbi:MAG TPA: DNA polymerase III subunit gamma/tau [Methyloceanibacter sp.]|nr:DNA polymerase III subunit gamma/tau [Methyloceanibacter sp.]
MAEDKDQQESAPKRSGKKAAKAEDTPAPAAGGQSHAALARKYRPKLFSELIGQDAMVQTLRNAFASGRIAQAYMLTGVRGVGKTTTARLIARALNYVRPGGEGAPTLDMTEEGEHCRAILESRHLDVVEMDAASHTGIDDIRDLIDSAHYKPNTARYKVYIIDEVHMLSKQAFNGLLKTLEEPPEHVKFIFATTEARKVPVTVLSRCQRFDLKRIEVEQLAQHLAFIVAQEGAAADPAALMLIARAAEGSVRDALSILDRAIAFGSGKVEAEAVRGLLGLADRGRIFDLLETVLAGDAGNALDKLSALNNDGAEPAQVITDLADAVHAVTLVKAAGTSDPAASEAERASAAELAKRLSMPVLARAWQMLLKGHDEVKSSARPHAAADMVLVRLAYAADLPTPGELMRRLGDSSGEGEGATRATPNKPREPAPVMRQDTAPPEPASVTETEDPTPQPSLADPKSFEEVVALAEEKRDLKLKHALSEQVRLVRFRPGHLELNPLPNAPKELGQDLMRKLNAWTGRVWIVALSGDEGAAPLGVQRREREAREIERIRDHPDVKQVLQHFPGARIAAVRATASEEPAGSPVSPAEIDEGAETEFKEDGTDP